MHVSRLYISIQLNELPLYLLAVFGFSNHIYGDQYAFEKTRRGCQLLKTALADLTDNYTKPITDEAELIRRAFGVLNDNTVWVFYEEEMLIKISFQYLVTTMIPALLLCIRIIQ